MRKKIILGLILLFILIIIFIGVIFKITIKDISEKEKIESTTNKQPNEVIDIEEEFYEKENINNDVLVIFDIPDIMLYEDTSTTIDLNDYIDNSEVTWTVSGNTNIDINIINGIATLIPVIDWYGQETIIFIATDPDGLFDEKSINIIVTPIDD